KMRDLSTLLANIRHIKSDFDEKNGVILAGRSLEPLQFYSAISPVLNQVLEHYRITWGGGYKKERLPHRWKNLGILLLGGCTKMPFIRNKLSWYNPGQDFCLIEPDVRLVELPGDIQVVGSRRDLCLKDYANLLMVAHGTSFHIGEIMSFFKPRDVSDDIPPPLPKNESPFFGHWW
ncbi:MAG: hypothetical protein RQ760_02245, partial [Sedimentisphaerales bacterium]|nr:hypothetical protein [Sedimentisphaerales bacterium]